MRPLLLTLLAATAAAAQEGVAPTPVPLTGATDLEALGLFAAAGLCNVCVHTEDCRQQFVRWGWTTLAACNADLNTTDALINDPLAYRLDTVAGGSKSDCIPAGKSPVSGHKYFFVFHANSCTGPEPPRLAVSVYHDKHCTDTVAVVDIPEADGTCQAVSATFEEPQGEEKWTTRFIVIIALTPFVTAIIGYGTNVIAIKMIFQPYEKKCGLQGVFPKRQHQLAQQIGDMVEKNLISADEMVAKMKKELGMDDNPNPVDPVAAPKESSLDQELKDGILGAINGMLEKRQDTPGFGLFLQAMGGKEAFRDNLTRGAFSAFKQNLPYLMETFAQSFTDFIPFAAIITDRIRNKMTPKDLEDMFMSFMATELGFVEQLGGVLGFIVGILQSAIFIVAGT
eukprot:TRINITY_DN9760_c0_g1_i1.p1 TRINITY_DN9760_c0_g1~~TRINITY_DN9760_c0_g1_i1.p1  ORF type:complete len:396 (+),score=131.83 TRINITY_DN9760_c0_g1_i1:59-1246(+)